MKPSKVDKDILGLFNRDIARLYSINQIAISLNKAYPHINAKVNSLIRNRILNKMVAGRSYLCSLNLNSCLTVAYLSLLEAEKKNSLEKKHPAVAEELRSVVKDFMVHTIVYHKKSIYFVLDHIYDREAIKKRMRKHRSLKLVFLTRQNFIKRLLEKSLLRDKTVLYASEKYFEIVEEVFPRLLEKVMFDEN